MIIILKTNFGVSLARSQKLYDRFRGYITLECRIGASECYRETGIMVWDVAAGLALVQGAGGVVQFKFLPQQH